MQSLCQNTVNSKLSLLPDINNLVLKNFIYWGLNKLCEHKENEVLTPTLLNLEVFLPLAAFPCPNVAILTPYGLQELCNGHAAILPT